MESRGKNPQKQVIAIIPARFESTRLHGKLLLPIAGKPLILHTLERARRARNVSRVIVATDDERIYDTVTAAGGEAAMTSPHHQSGSDRLAEVAERLDEGTIIVNVQGDEPAISPVTIEQAVDGLLNDEAADIATTSESVEAASDVLDPNVVKVVTDENGFALYFSRSPIPFPREAVLKYGTLQAALAADVGLISLYRKHTGIYVYRREFLLRFTKLSQSDLERTESLEQLRALAAGARIKVVEAKDHSVGVDTLDDYNRVKSLIEGHDITFRPALPSDLPTVAKVHVESWQRSFAGVVPQDCLDKMTVEARTVAFERGFDENRFYEMLVAEDTEKGIVGFADFGAARGDNEFDSELYAIYFLPEFQKRGIGTRLFRLCQKQLAENGFRSMRLDTLEASPYREFYEKLGGQVVATGKHDLAGVEFGIVVYGWRDLGGAK